MKELRHLEFSVCGGGFAVFLAVSLRLTANAVFIEAPRLNPFAIACRNERGGIASRKKAFSGKPEAYRNEGGRAATVYRRLFG